MCSVHQPELSLLRMMLSLWVLGLARKAPSLQLVRGQGAISKEYTEPVPSG